MTRLHLVLGGELVDPSKTTVKGPGNLRDVGIFPDYGSARTAAAQVASSTEELG